MLIAKLLMNFLLAGIAVASAVPSEKNGLMSVHKDAKRQFEEEDAEEANVLVDYSVSVETSCDSHIDIIYKACAAGKIEIVKGALLEIFVKLHALREKCYQGIAFEFAEVVAFSNVFIKLLLKFQAIFSFMFRYQFIWAQCIDILFKYGFEFNDFFKFFLGYKLDLKPLAISAGFDFSLFAGIGFSI